MPRALNLKGQRFGRLLVLGRLPPGNKNVMWRCVCDCGQTYVCAASNLARGNTVSCGCFRSEQSSARQRTHGLSRTAEYIIWTGMINRCHSPINNGYKNYGERGIAVCDRWRDSFEAFLQDMGPRPSSQFSIERKDNRQGYSPDNCKWATGHEQGRNKRTNRFIEIDGVTMCIADWCERVGIDRRNIYRAARYKNRGSVEAVIRERLDHRGGLAIGVGDKEPH